MANNPQESTPAPSGNGAPRPDLELLTKDTDGKWQQVGALWRKPTVKFSGTVTLGEQTVHVIAVEPRPIKANATKKQQEAS